MAPTKMSTVADGIRQALGEHGVEQCRVGADARDEVAGAARVELADRQVQDARDELAAARVDDGGAGALQQVVLVARDDGRHDDQCDECPHEPAERVALLHARDELADQQRLGERRDSAEDAEHDDDDQHALVLEEEGEQLARSSRGVRLWSAACGRAVRRRGGGRGHR